MKAAIFKKYGPPEVLKIQEVPKPVIQDHQVLIKVHATTVTPMDYRTRSADAPLWPISRMMMGFWKPKQEILGTEVAGEVVEVGKDVTKYKLGDKVFGFGRSAYAEYIAASEKSVLEEMPTNVNYEEGASIGFGGITSMHFLKSQANIQKGQRVLINGASGGCGVYAVQLAKHYGAIVTGVCSGKNVELVKSLGADRVIDYTKTDFTKEKDQKYDIIFDVVAKSSFRKCRKILAKNGLYINTVPTYGLFLKMFLRAKLGKKKIITGVAEAGDSLTILKELVESKKLQIVIDRTYPLEQIVDAHAYAEKGHKVGSVVISVNHQE